MPYMEFLRKEGKTPNTGAYTEETILCPVSETELMAMLIHKIHLYCGIPEIAAGEDRTMNVQLTSDSKNAIVSWEDNDVLAKFSWGAFASTTLIAGAQIESHVVQIEPPVKYFDPPILYSKRELYLGGYCSAAIPLKFGVIIGYTLERVSRADFIAALVG